MARQPKDPLRATFEELLAQEHESLTVEFKEPLDWDDRRDAGKLVKSIICLANRDGGYILVGKRQNPDKTFTPVGISHDLAAKLETTKVNSRLNQYVAPSINAHSALFDDPQGRRYVVIHAPGFTRIPHIVTKDYNLPDPKGGRSPQSLFREGDFLIRTNDNDCRKITRPEDMTAVIERAMRFREDEIAERTARIIENRHLLRAMANELQTAQLQLVPQTNPYEDAAKEAWERFNSESHLGRKYKTYREVAFYPAAPAGITYGLKSRDELEGWLKASRTIYRGDSFPFALRGQIKRRSQGIEFLSEEEGGGMWGTRIEFWELLTNGFFYYAELPWEDTLGVQARAGGPHFKNAIGVGSVLGLLFAAARLAQKLYEGRKEFTHFHLQFRIRGAAGRHLVVDDPSRAPFVANYVCNEPEVESKRVFALDEVAPGFYEKLLQMAADIFWPFGWDGAKSSMRDVLPFLDRELKRVGYGWQPW